MEILRYLLMVVELLTCILLVGVILLQKSKGQGMGMAFGAGVGEALFGAQTGNVLTKTTIVLAAVFLINTTLLSLIGSSGRAASRSIADKIPDAKPAATQAVPGPGTGGEMPVSSMPAGQAQVPDMNPQAAQVPAATAPVPSVPQANSPAPAPAPAPVATPAK